MTTESREERLERVLKSVLMQQNSVLGFLHDVLKQTPPEGQTSFDLLCERLEKVDEEKKS